MSSELLFFIVYERTMGLIWFTESKHFPAESTTREDTPTYPH